MYIVLAVVKLRITFSAHLDVHYVFVQCFEPLSRRFTNFHYYYYYYYLIALSKLKKYKYIMCITNERLLGMLAKFRVRACRFKSHSGLSLSNRETLPTECVIRKEKTRYILQMLISEGNIAYFTYLQLSPV